MGKRQILAVVAGILTLAAGIFAVRLIWFVPEVIEEGMQPEPVTAPQEISLTSKRLTGPYTYNNLSIYLVHGENTMQGAVPITLDEAIKADWGFVHETGDVNELAVENRSAKLEIFIQAGDIVKGGQQDRVLGVDLIIPPKSGSIPIDSFCVEHGRWTARGSERRDRFNSSADYVPSKNIKLAAKSEKSQARVWNEVDVQQDKLSAATNTNTASAVSNSSLQLTLENADVREDSGEFVKELSNIIEGKSDVIGFLFTINGEINSSDIYGSNGLFKKLWPKLLQAAAIEAVAERPANNAKVKLPETADIEAFFADAENAKVTEDRKVTERINMKTRESETIAFFETRDRGVMLHLSYIWK